MKAATITGWSPELERSFKQVLFRFLEDVHSTKAALYLLAPDGAFLLATQYGFGRRDTLATRHEEGSPLVHKAKEIFCRPVAVNQRLDFPEFAEALSLASTHRLLLVPVCRGSEVVGIVDARDKGKKLPFSEGDVDTAAKIAEDLAQLVQMTGIVRRTAEEEAVAPAPAPVRPAVGATATEAGLLLDRSGLARLHRELEVEMAREQGLVAVGLAVVDDEREGVRILFAEAAQDDDRSPMLHHQAEALRHLGLEPSPPDTWMIRAEIFPKSVDTAASPRVIGSEVMASKESWALVASAIGVSETGAVPRTLGRLRTRTNEVTADSGRRFSRRKMAYELLHPGERVFKDLERHSRATSRLAWLVARQMGASDDLAEEAALAGLLHDLGMIDLDYEGLYRHPDPGSVEKRIFRGHSEAGERRLVLTGMEGVAEAVRHHHERWDGSGYPDRIAGGNIPLLSRIVHAAEVFDVLTSSNSYRRQVTPERALAVLRSEAERQFDPAVVEALAQVVEMQESLASGPESPGG